MVSVTQFPPMITINRRKMDKLHFRTQGSDQEVYIHGYNILITNNLVLRPMVPLIQLATLIIILCPCFYPSSLHSQIDFCQTRTFGGRNRVQIWLILGLANSGTGVFWFIPMLLPGSWGSVSYHSLLTLVNQGNSELTHWSQNKMVTIVQEVFYGRFILKKVILFWLKSTLLL